MYHFPPYFVFLLVSSYIYIVTIGICFRPEFEFFLVEEALLSQSASYLVFQLLCEERAITAPKRQFSVESQPV